MKEIQNILATFEPVSRQGQRAALATVVQTSGSVYRRAGARMLITETGQQIGSISGGCLESDIGERAQAVMASNEPALVVYDAIANDDLLWGLGLGCNGVVTVLIEALTATSCNPLTFIANCLHERQFGVLATVFQAEGVQTPIGRHLMLHADGRVSHNLQELSLTQQIMADAQIVLRSQQSRCQQYDSAIGTVTVYLELIQPPLPLLLLGAGQDAIPVAHFAKALGWHVTVVDRRPAYVTPDRFPMADQVRVARPEQGLSDLIGDSRTAAVVMTHNYFDDREWLKLLLPSSLPYVGLLGPRHRTKRLLQDLAAEGCSAASNQCHHFYTPIGLDLGAETPEAIALAIVAEIQAVLANRAGGMLRDRTARIHAQREVPLCLPLG